MVWEDWKEARGCRVPSLDVAQRREQGEWYGPVYVAFGYNSVNGEFWAIVSDEPTDLHTFEEDGLRLGIAALASRRVEAFLDAPSNGWNLQKIEFPSVYALSRPWFFLAVAPL